jgi:hypothetical protein
LTIEQIVTALLGIVVAFLTGALKMLHSRASRVVERVNQHDVTFEKLAARIAEMIHDAMDKHCEREEQRFETVTKGLAGLTLEVGLLKKAVDNNGRTRA